MHVYRRGDEQGQVIIFVVAGMLAMLGAVKLVITLGLL